MYLDASFNDENRALVCKLAMVGWVQRFTKEASYAV